VPRSSCPVWLSRRRYFLPVPPDRANGQGRPGYKLIENIAQVERGTDIHTLLVDRMISVTPLSLDLTSRIPIGVRHRQLPGTDASSQPTETLSELLDQPSSPRPGTRGSAVSLTSREKTVSSRGGAAAPTSRSLTRR